VTRTPALELSGISYGYGPQRVLHELDLAVAPGTVLGLLGVNGAGKSTLISIATGLLRPDAGRALVEGVDVSQRRLEVAGRIGVAPQRLGLYPPLTVRQNLMVFAELARLRGRAARLRVDEVIDLLELRPQADKAAGELSGGQQRRVHTGMALVGRPQLLFLDEPTVGADTRSRQGILSAVRDLAADGTCVIYTSHIMTEFDELDAEMAVLHGGLITARGRIPDLLSAHSESSVLLRFRSTAPRLAGWQRSDERTLVHTGAVSPGAALREAFTALAASPAGSAGEVVDVQLRRPSLEDAFHAITGVDATATVADDAEPNHDSLTVVENGARR